ncbi:MAG: hypothetical protein KatS3mg001_127 [Candidatus Pacearchaeota archaeon]|nr:MAG: hypothetical protein KatS3mg001_127 [Candidatus Pacearchaeota archaeon]
MVKKENSLENMKKSYELLKKKYKLPTFKELNEEFWIEEISNKETDFLIRHIRIKVADFLFRVARFIESLINPTNPSMFTIFILKAINQDDKKILSEIHKKITKMEIEYIKLDVFFSEEKEAEFIKESYNFWQNTKKNFFNILEKVEKSFDSKKENNTRGYFG